MLEYVQCLTKEHTYKLDVDGIIIIIVICSIIMACPLSPRLTFSTFNLITISHILYPFTRIHRFLPALNPFGHPLMDFWLHITYR